MTLKERCKVSLADARAELAELESSFREQRKTLKALIRVLESQEESDDAGTKT
jgi:hypothetical protein